RKNSACRLHHLWRCIKARRHGAFDTRRQSGANMQRPTFFNVFQIQLPVGAITSVTHRISGILLATGIPFSIYLLERSLASPDGYQQAIGLLHSFPVRFLAIFFAWALGHHLLAGVRHLLSDVDIGSRLHEARRSAWIVNCVSPLFAVLAAVAFL